MIKSAYALLRVADVSKSYGAHTALANVDLVVREGELVVLLGNNGAGKSTLLQLVTGLFTADSGTIEVCSHDIRTNVVEVLAALGVVFQQPTVDLELSVEANLRFHAELQGLTGAQTRARITASLERFDLVERRKDALRVLSGGNRRRVELARALLHDPRLIVMDEATVGLDPASRREILTYVKSLRNSGMGVLWTTHLIDEAAQADRIVVMHRGRVIFDGPPETLSPSGSVHDLADAFLTLTALSGQ